MAAWRLGFTKPRRGKFALLNKGGGDHPPQPVSLSLLLSPCLAIHDRDTPLHHLLAWPASLNQRYYSAYLCGQAGISFVEFQATSPAAK